MLACAGIVVASPAFASEPSIVFEVQGCERADEIRRIIALELGEPLGELGGDAREKVRGAIVCTGAAVSIRIDAAASSHVDRMRPLRGTRPRPSERTLDLATTPVDVQPRVIALAAVELIASRGTVSTPMAMSSEATDATPAVAATRLTTRARPTMRVGALASVEAFPGHVGGLLGGGLRIMRDAGIVDVFVDARAHHGADRVSLGAVSVTTVDGALGAARARTWHELELALAVGVRGGKVWFAGTPDMEVRGATFSAPWWGTFVAASVERAVSSTLRASLGVELGVVALPAGALVGGGREVAIDGAWIAAHGGVVAAW
ncbi:MAG TPA: hypothetical protein VM513_28340 [Kofleriaceae bacterium]|nr:hypothetical protein [Kofleriaceae bacterium]